MNILAADDEKLALSALVDTLKEAMPDATIYPFQYANDLLEFAKKTPCDIAFLDIEMNGESGIEVAKKLKEKQKEIGIIFVTGHSNYALEAFQMHANGYLMKPITPEDVKKEVEHLRKPVTKEKDKKLHVQCFGNFEVFFEGKAVEFNRSKSKEVFAYLIHRNGAVVTTPDIAGIIWEDGIFGISRQKQLQTIISDLRKSLGALGFEDVIVKSKLGLSIDKSKIDCDLYNFIKGDVDAINSYLGEYMINYYWAEFTTDYLDTVKLKR